MRSRRRGTSVPQCPKSEAGDLCHVVRKGLVWRIRVKLGFGEAHGPVCVQQWQCRSHGYFREYPMFLVPRKHYAAHVIDELLDRRASGESVERVCDKCGLEDPSTVRRWASQVVARLRELRQSAVVRPLRLLSSVGEALCEKPFRDIWLGLDLFRTSSPDLHKRYPTRTHLALSL